MDSSAQLAELAILAVDDNAMNREFLHSALNPLTRRLVLARNGREAVEHCRRERFDLVLMDLHMPDMDGVTAWQNICKEAGGSPPTRIIALTADCREKEQVRLLNAGFDGFLTKPVTLARLTEAIDRIVSGRGGIDQPTEDYRRNRLLDDRRALAATNHDPELVTRLRRILAEDLKRQAPRLDAHLASGNLGEAAAILHQWAGACGYAGATGLEQSCRALQRSLERELDSSPGTQYVHLLNLLECTRQAIRMQEQAGAARA